MKDTIVQRNRESPSLLGIPRPWVITLFGFVVLTVSSANVTTFGIFFKPIALELELSRSVVAGSFSARMIVMAILVAPLGYLSDRYGPRIVLFPCLLLLSVGMALLSKVSTVWELYLIQGLLIGASVSGTFVCVTSAIGKWHSKNRGLALGIAAGGLGLSSVVFAPLTAKLIQDTGWRDASIVLAVIVLLTAAPASLFLANPRAADEELTGALRNRSKGLFQSWRLFPMFFRTPPFPAIALMFFLFTTAANLVITHFVNYATDVGASAAVAAAMMGAQGISSTTGRLTMGAVSDRLGVKTTLIICFTTITGGLLLLEWNFSFSMMWVAILLFGFAHGGEVPLMPGLIGEQFGTRNLATVTGVALIGTYIGAAVGPWLGGFLFDLFGNYSLALALATLMTLVGTALAWRLRPATQPALEKLQAVLLRAENH